MKIEQIAQICHEANKIICEQNGDFKQKSWNEAEQWQRDSSIESVKFHLANPDADDSATHDAWMAERIASGWVYGEVKDEDKKTNPALVPFPELPAYQQSKDAVQKAITNGLSKFVEM